MKDRNDTPVEIKDINGKSIGKIKASTYYDWLNGRLNYPLTNDEQKVISTYERRAASASYDEEAQKVFEKYEINPQKVNDATLRQWAKAHNFELQTGVDYAQYVSKKKNGKKLTTKEDERALEILSSIAAENRSRDFAEEKPIWSNVMNTAAAPARGVVAAMSNIKDTYDTATGKGIDMYSSLRQPFKNDATIKEVSSEAAKNWFGGAEIPVIGGSVGEVLYGALTSMGENIANVAFTGGASFLTSLLMGNTAAASAVLENKKKGYSDTESLMLGLTSGAVETLFEKYSLDAIWNSPTTAIKSLLRGALIEGSEEMGTETANKLINTIVMRDDSDVMREIKSYIESGDSPLVATQKASVNALADIFRAGLAGAISGVGLGGGARLKNIGRVKAIGAETRNRDTGVQGVIEQGISMDTETDSFKIAQRLQKKQTNGKHVTDYELGELAIALKNDSKPKENSETDTLLQRATELAKRVAGKKDNVSTDNTQGAIQPPVSSQGSRATEFVNTLKSKMEVPEVYEGEILNTVTQGDFGKSTRSDAEIIGYADTLTKNAMRIYEGKLDLDYWELFNTNLKTLSHKDGFAVTDEDLHSYADVVAQAIAKKNSGMYKVLSEQADDIGQFIYDTYTAGNAENYNGNVQRAVNDLGKLVEAVTASGKNMHRRIFNESTKLSDNNLTSGKTTGTIDTDINSEMDGRAETGSAPLIQSPMSHGMPNGELNAELSAAVEETLSGTNMLAVVKYLNDKYGSTDIEAFFGELAANFNKDGTLGNLGKLFEDGGKQVTEVLRSFNKTGGNSNDVERAVQGRSIHDSGDVGRSTGERASEHGGSLSEETGDAERTIRQETTRREVSGVVYNEVSEEHYTDEMTEVARENTEKYGLKTVYFKGVAVRGNVKADGFYCNGTIYLQSDSPAKTVRSIRNHEITHHFAGTNAYKKFRSRVKSKMSKKQFEQWKAWANLTYGDLADAYIVKKFEQSGGTLTDEQLHELREGYLEEEMMANLNGEQVDFSAEYAEEIETFRSEIAGGKVEADGNVRLSKRLTQDDVQDYLRAGNRSNQSKQKAFKEGKKIVLVNDDELTTFIHDSINGSKDLNTVGYGKVNERLSRDVDLYSNGKIKIEDSFLELVPYDIKHAYDEHLKAKETGDIDLSLSDFENIPSYIDDYDELVYATRYKSGNTRICLSKKLPNGRVLIIETVSKSRGSIAFKNMIGVSEEKYVNMLEEEHKKRNNSNSRGSESSNISLRDETVSNNSVPQKEVTVNSNSMQEGEKVSEESIKFSVNDAKYMEAVESGDMDSAQRMVEEAARVAGYNSPLLYHGTGAFGFTEFDLSKSDDKRTIFLTSNEKIASTYSGVSGTRKISDVYNKDVDKLSAEEVSNELNNFVKEYYKDTFEFADYNYSYYNLEKLNNLINTVNDGLVELKSYVEQKITEYADRMAYDFDDTTAKTHRQLVSLKEKLDKWDYHNLSTPIYLLIHHTDALADNSAKYADLEANIRLMNSLRTEQNIDEGVVVEESLGRYSIEIMNKDEAVSKLKSLSQKGNYAMYAKMENPLVIYGEGQNWNNIRNWSKYAIPNTGELDVVSDNGFYYLKNTKTGKLIEVASVTVNSSTEKWNNEQLKDFMLGKLTNVIAIKTENIKNTREIAKYAKDSGYDGVVIRDITDNGGRNYNVGYDETADIYILFDANNAKSADPVTYDDNGDVIPLSERFSDSDDIRFDITTAEKAEKAFKDSVIRDEEGKLKVMYRGGKDNFNVFDRKKSKPSNLYGRGFYFTDSKAIAERYGDVREYYLNIKEPLQHGNYDITKEQMREFLKAVAANEDEYDIWNYGTTDIDDILNNIYGKDDFGMIQDVSATAIGDLVEAVELFNEVNNTAYDGIVLQTETVAFQSKQIKLSAKTTYDDEDNEIPLEDRFSSSDDIRFSVKEKWKPDLNKQQLDTLMRKIRHDIKTSENTVTDTANWFYTNIGDTDVFSIYSTIHENDPTLLYEVKGKQAEFERDYLYDILEVKKHGESTNEKSIFAGRISGGEWLQRGRNNANNLQRVGTGSNNRNVGVLQRQSSRKPRAAFVSIIENLFEVQQGRDRVKLSVATETQDRITHIARNEIFTVSKDVNEKLASQIDNWLKGDMHSNEVFEFGNTSCVLRELGAPDLPVVMTQNTMAKVTGGKHNITLENIRNLPQSLAEPLMVFKSATVPNAFIVLTEMEDMQGDSIVTAMHLNKTEKHIAVNRLASVYGKYNSGGFIAEQIKKGNLKYIDKIKSQNWSQSRGLQLPKLADTNPDNNSILEKEDIVKKYFVQKQKSNTKDIKFSVSEQPGVMWTMEQGVLDRSEVSAFYSKVSELRNNKYHNYVKSSDGEYIFAIKNKMVFTDGEYEYPEISRVVTLNTDNETEADTIRRLFYDLQKSINNIEDTLSVVESVYGQGSVTQANIENSGTYEGLSGHGQRKHGRTSDSRSGKDVKFSSTTDTQDRITHIARNEIFTVSKDVNEKLASQIDNWLKGDMHSNEVFEFGNTSCVLRELGAPDLPVVMTQNTMAKVTGGKHSITLENIRNLPQSLAEPLMVFKSATVPNAFIVLTEMEDRQGDSIVTAMHLNKSENRLNVNRIASIYGKYNSGGFIAEQIKKGNLKYIDKIKSQNWSTSRGLQLPKLVQSNPDNNSILEKEDIVKKYFVQKQKSNTGDIKFDISKQPGVMWTMEQGVLDRNEVSAFYSKVSELRNNKYRTFKRSADGEHIFEITNKLTFTDGDYEYPTITKVITFDTDDTDLLEYGRSMVYDGEQNGHKTETVVEVIEAVLGEGNVKVADNGNYEANKGTHKEERINTGERNNGRTSDSGSREDVKFSINTDEALGYIKENEELQQEIANIQSQFRVSKAPNIVYTKATKLIREILADMKSEAKFMDIKDEIYGVYNDWYFETKQAKGNKDKTSAATEKMIKRFVDIAGRIVETASEVDAESQEYYQKVAKLVKGTRIVVSDDTKNNFDFNEFREKHIGSILIANEGTPLDIAYQRFCEAFPDLFDATITDGVDQLNAIAEALDSLKPEPYNPHMNQIQDAVEECATRLILGGDGITEIKNKTPQQPVKPKAETTINTATEERTEAPADTEVNDKWDELIEKHGAIKPGGNPSRDIQVPKKSSDTKYVSLFARSLAESEIMPDNYISELQKDVVTHKLSHIPITDKDAKKYAFNKIDELGFDGAMNYWNALADAENVPGKKDIVLGEVLLNQCLTAGDWQSAEKITADLAHMATRSGQSTQAFSMLQKMSPDGKLYCMEKSIQTLNNELKKQLGKKGKDFEIKLNEELAREFLFETDEFKRQKALDKLHEDIAKQIPATKMDKWNAWRYLSMLGNPRTHFRNVVGNILMASASRVKNYVGAILEITLIRDKSKRTKALHADKSAVDFAKGDFLKVLDAIKGYDGKYDIKFGEINDKRTIFKTKALENLRKFNSYALEMEDEIFLKAAYADALARVMTARGLTAEFLNSGTREAVTALESVREYAIKEALEATFRDASVVADKLSEISRQMARGGIMGKLGAFVLEGVLPFKKTPLNILKRGVEYSPVSVIKSAAKAAQNYVEKRKGELTDGDVITADIINDFAKGLTGTTLLMVGALLARGGVLLGAEDEDKDKKKFDEANGFQGYALKIGGHTYTIDWAAPAVMPILVGAEIWNRTKESGVTFADFSDALFRITEPVLQLSCLQGLESVFDSVSFDENAKIYAAFTDAVTSYAMQAVPSLFGQLARTVDKTRRDPYYVDKNSNVPENIQIIMGQIQAKLPGMGFRLEPKLDAWGREMTYGDTVAGRALSNFVSPGYLKKIDNSKVTKKLYSLYDETGDNSIFPTAASKYINIGKKDYEKYGLEPGKINLTGEQYTFYAKKKGEHSLTAITELVNSSYYDSMINEDKIKYIENCYTDAGAKAKAELIEKYFLEK